MIPVRESEMTIKDETKALHGEQPTVSQHNFNDAKPNGRDIFSAKITTSKKILSACKSVDV